MQLVVVVVEEEALGGDSGPHTRRGAGRDSVTQGRIAEEKEEWGFA